jgi:predicted RND superfamily exporter protein
LTALRLRDRWIAWILARHRLVLTLGLALTVVAGLLASRLTIESDLRALLPAEHPVMRSLASIESSFVRLGSVNVLVRGGDAPQRRALADALAGPLAALPEIAEVEYRLRSDYFADHALYYLSDLEMAELEEHVQAWTHYEACSRDPDLCMDEPDEGAPERLRAFVRGKQGLALDRAGFADYFERDGTEALVLLAHPIKDSSDLVFSQKVTEDTRAVVERIRAEAQPGLEVSVVGPYAIKADEQATIRRDMLTSGAFALVGVCAILLLLFRSGRAVFTLLVPLLCGVAWSMGATQLALGHLNTMTSLISTVVMGMGIDAGIHFLHRARRERQQSDDAAAISSAFGGLIVPLLVASVTTLSAFVVMASSTFPAFREFGLIAALGVALCLLAMTTVFPALLLLVGIKDRPVAARPGERGRLAGLLVLRPGLIFALVLVASAIAGLGARGLAFEGNGRMLQSASRRDQVREDTQLISKVFGKDIHAGVLVVDSLDEARAVLRRARADQERRLADGVGTRVAEIFAAPDLLPDPAIDPQARQQAIAALTEDMSESAWDKLAARAEAQEGAADDGALSPDDARRLQRMLKAEPVELTALPATIRHKIRSEDGRLAVYAYPNFDAADIFKGVEFMEETRAYVDDPERLRFVGETTVYAAMYLMMKSEAPTIIATAAGVIALLVLLQLRSARLTFITLLPLLLAILWLVGLMGAIDLRFTLFNVPILPAVLGIGVDNGVYLTDRLRRLTPGEDARPAITETSAAILAATSTTAIGFAAFILADSGGLQGIGALAVLGILSAAAAAVLIVPSLFALLLRR